jgi:DNA-binding GntR family transcriptional regulator
MNQYGKPRYHKNVEARSIFLAPVSAQRASPAIFFVLTLLQLFNRTVALIQSTILNSLECIYRRMNKKKDGSNIDSWSSVDFQFSSLK